MDVLSRVPAWLLMPLPTNAVVDETLIAQVNGLALQLPDSIGELTELLRKYRHFAEYDTAANLACAQVWLALDQFYGSGSRQLLCRLLDFAALHMVEQGVARICRRLVKHVAIPVRAHARRIVMRLGLREVALPLDEDQSWDASGWSQGVYPEGLSEHPQGTRVQERHGLPALATVADLRQLLGIKSTRQLGFFLLASDKDDGPYFRFTIPKRDGSDRIICAPRGQLRWVQRQVLDKILSKVPLHNAAHGFVPTRSTVTNATAHKGARLLLKFDLSDFFPTIHYYRAVGLFASLGYHAGSVRFSARDDSRNLAPTLARLCCYTPDPKSWGTAVTPQGAPTSPVISNLVCRRLDARLTGLAQRNEGVYTRYADDLTFSFKEDNLNLGRFRWWVDQICHQEGFLINHKKFRVIRASQRQVVTGIVVNDELRIPRDERRRFRAILHNCRTKGLDSQARGHPRFSEYLRGFASYIHMVHPEEGAELLRQVEDLLGHGNAPATGP